MRLLTRLALLLTPLFAACIGLIRAQPYDDTSLRAFLAPPDDCPRPCFIGLRPGATTVEQAMAILESHDWIAGVNRYEATDGRGVTALTAAWSGTQPEFIESGEELWLGVEGNIVQALVIPTRIPLAHIWLLFGIPDYGDLTFGVSYLPSAGYAAIYFDTDSIFVSEGPCPIESVWKLPVRWVLRHDGLETSVSQSHALPVQVHRACRNALRNP